MQRRHLLQLFSALLASAPFTRLLAQRKAACGPTGSATEGPYYVANAPRLTQLARGLKGPPMKIAGQVFGGTDGSTPLANVRVEIWHCDAAGDYHPHGNGDISRYAPAEINLRGHTFTDAEGRFAFDSIVPAAYGNRRRHIHWRFSAPGHRVLVTQSYWQDELNSDRSRRDFVDRDAEACRWVSFTTNAQGVSEGFFPVQLERA